LHVGVKRRKVFFFEKKKQKTFANAAGRWFKRRIWVLPK
jgi:hypothetical protein